MIDTEAEVADDDVTGIGKMFKDPNMWGKLAANPKTAPLLQDQQFVGQVCTLHIASYSITNGTQLRMIQANPALAGSSFNDPRMISVLGVLMGIDMEGFAREPGSDEMPPGLSKKAEPTSPQSPPSATASKPSTSTSVPKTQPTKPKEEDVKMAEPEPEDDEEAVAKKQALAEKAKGNDHYKKRGFEGAITSFKKAWELWPKDITFLTNLAGMSLFFFTT